VCRVISMNICIAPLMCYCAQRAGRHCSPVHGTDAWWLVHFLLRQVTAEVSPGQFLCCTQILWSVSLLPKQEFTTTLLLE
jgi:hypothetical protein